MPSLSSVRFFLVNTAVQHTSAGEAVPPLQKPCLAVQELPAIPLAAVPSPSVGIVPGQGNGCLTEAEAIQLGVKKDLPQLATAPSPPLVLGRHSPVLRWALGNDQTCSRALAEFTTWTLGADFASAEPVTVDLPRCGVRVHCRDANRLIQLRRSEEPNVARTLGKDERVWLRLGDCIGVKKGHVVLQLIALCAVEGSGGGKVELPHHRIEPPTGVLADHVPHSLFSHLCTYSFPRDVSRWGQLPSHRRRQVAQDVWRQLYEYGRVHLQHRGEAANTDEAPPHQHKGEEDGVLAEASVYSSRGSACREEGEEDSEIEAATPTESQRFRSVRSSSATYISAIERHAKQVAPPTAVALTAPVPHSRHSTLRGQPECRRPSHETGARRTTHGAPHRSVKELKGSPTHASTPDDSQLASQVPSTASQPVPALLAVSPSRATLNEEHHVSPAESALPSPFRLYSTRASRDVLTPRSSQANPASQTSAQSASMAGPVLGVGRRPSINALQTYVETYDEKLDDALLRLEDHSVELGTRLLQEQALLGGGGDLFRQSPQAEVGDGVCAEGTDEEEGGPGSSRASASPSTSCTALSQQVPVRGRKSRGKRKSTNGKASNSPVNTTASTTAVSSAQRVATAPRGDRKRPRGVEIGIGRGPSAPLRTTPLPTPPQPSLAAEVLRRGLPAGMGLPLVVNGAESQEVFFQH